MVIGTLIVTLQCPESQGLKEKRRILRSLTARLRQTFNISAAEIADQDLWQLATLGVACVSSDARHADEMCQKVLRSIENDGRAALTGSRFELVHI